MKLKHIPILSIFASVFFLSCKGNKSMDFDNSISQKLQFNRNINHLIEYALSYTPKNLCFNDDINDSLMKYDLNYIFSDSTSLIEQKKVINIFLLRQYNYHLIRAHQGFNLNMMKQGPAALIINRFIYLYELDANGSITQFINSSNPFLIIKDDSEFMKVKIIDSLVNQIEFQIESILQKIDNNEFIQ